MTPATRASRPMIWFAAVGVAAVLSGCATKAPPQDYSAFIRAKPATLLVLPPINDTPDVTATPGVWSQVTLPLSEAGYYVLPVTLVDETFRQNGITVAHDAHDIPVEKLREFFGADAGVYIAVKTYGTSYSVIASETRVTLEGRIVDLRSGQLLWQGQATASSAEHRLQTQGGLVGVLAEALVQQIVSTATDESYRYAGIASSRLLAAPRYNGVLPGPRSPHFGKPPPSR